MVTSCSALSLRGSAVASVTTPLLGVGQRGWPWREATNGRREQRGANPDPDVEEDESWRTFEGEMQVIEQESEERRQLIHAQRIAEEMRVLQIDTHWMDPADVVIINAQKA
ncbi:hypothetical protein Tco_1041977 [Tanacetum coccineum]|uniref:Uncharacterized protein n=1 Tax=Tanacetum coccineum TaxID=301880 RepID=A0ABQ5GJY4_9ASTR